MPGDGADRGRAARGRFGGSVVGRWTWEQVAGSVGSVSPVIIPSLALVAAVAVTMGIANLVAVGPGWSASRAYPGEALRSE